MNIKPSIVWFRQDLRIHDHPALNAAIEKGGPIIPLYIWAPREEEEWAPGAASRWWLHKSLLSLEEALATLGLSLTIRRHDTVNAIKDIIQETGADAVYWNRRYEPSIIQRDAYLKAELKGLGLKAQSFNGSLLVEPWEVSTNDKKPCQVFTPFWKKCVALGEPSLPFKAPSKALSYPSTLESEPIASLQLLPKIQWDAGIEESWKPGCRVAEKLLQEDITAIIPQYLETRNRPDILGTSHLSPYLHFGELSPRMIYHAVKNQLSVDDPSVAGFIRQLYWREFAHHLLYHFPFTTKEPLRKSFQAFPWHSNDLQLKAWQKGMTGYPVVDAGMRELWHTGWMHNRVRMITGSFLVKDLLISWKEGAKWFWDTLVDADLANNTLGWQWIGGCGADAAPYFRVFNPVLQGEKFDVTGDYVRKWVPELARLPDKWLQKPWLAPQDVLDKAGITLGETYPKPIVDHDVARLKALEAFAKL